MQSKSLRWTVLSFLVVLVAAISTQGTLPGKGRQPVIPNFAALNKEKADEASDSLLNSHQQIVASLIQQFESEKSPAEAKTYIAYILGELRAVQAAPPLVAQIDLEAPWVDPAIKIGRWGKYPAAEALRKIGLPAVYEILVKLGKEQNETRRKLMFGVIKERCTVEVGLLLLRKSAIKEEDPQRKKRLEYAVKEFERLYPE